MARIAIAAFATSDVAHAEIDKRSPRMEIQARFLEIRLEGQQNSASIGECSIVSTRPTADNSRHSGNQDIDVTGTQSINRSIALAAAPNILQLER